ncbi:MAG: UDP-2,3-diacylglucosamine diphosphatase [Cyclobacteriaceae bacterium]|nr:UDP-2,3-diacylglucosamine diphosphatase [Cyclobacteriaceae bacterium]
MGKKRKREVELVIISDVHLGTYGCHAEELLRYLKSIKPKRIILNGDIIDMWQFSKRYWPKSHMQVIKHVTNLIAKGVKVTYLTGNHDEMLRRFAGFKMGSFEIANKKVVTLNGKSAWIFHGDVFDVTMQHSKWLAHLGAMGYDALILINRFVNFLLKIVGQGKISLSKRVKDSVKQAIKFINDFEQTAAEIAIANQYHYVVCGHIHHPEKKIIANSEGEVMYLNSGDWVENLTALEYNEGAWEIYRYASDVKTQHIKLSKHAREDRNNDEIFKDLVSEFLTHKR